MNTQMNYRADVPQKINYPYIGTDGDLEIELIKFNKSGNHYILQVGIPNLEKDNYRLCLNDSCLTIIASEPLEYSRPIHMHNMNWKIFSPQSFDMVKQADIYLPNEDLQVVRHIAHPEDNVLVVVLKTKYKNQRSFKQ